MSEITSPIVLDSTAQDMVEQLTEIAAAIYRGQGLIQRGSIELTTSWSGITSPYSQTVTVIGGSITNNSKVDLQPTHIQLALLMSDGVKSLSIENNNGVLTAYAIGSAPSSAMTIQCTVEETV